MRIAFARTLAGGLLTLGLSPVAHAVCRVAQVLPTDGAVSETSPSFSWTARDCAASRIQFSPSCTFGTSDLVSSSWATRRSYTMSDAQWQLHRSGDWSDGVCWRVQGRGAGATTSTGSRWIYTNDPATGNDAFLVGAAEFDWAGTSIAWIGDVDGDGNEDLLVGAPYADDGGADTGSAYLFYGPVYGTVDLSDADAVLVGEVAYADAGQAVAAAGDVNGDGRADYLVGAPGDGAGVAYLLTEPVYGLVDLGDVGAGIDGARIEGERGGDSAGGALVAAGDLDGDGYGDIVVGAPSRDAGAGSPTTGAGYVLHGPLTDDIALGCTIAGTCDGARILFTGSAMAAIGDVDGDGYGDLLLGTPGFDLDGGYDHIGVARIMNGPFSGEVTMSGATAQAQLFGDDAEGDDGAGAAVASGDFDGDGTTDVAIAAPGRGTGEIEIFLGPVADDYGMSDADITIIGEVGEPLQGTFTVGDANGDGDDDLLVGSFNVETDHGAAYLFLGPLPGGTISASAADVRIEGNPDTFLGNAVALGDGDGDGRDDLFVGIVGDSTGGFRAGAAAIYYDVTP